jgi:hypothetical protein
LRQNRQQLFARKVVVAAGVGYKITGETWTSTLSIVCSVINKRDAAGMTSSDRLPETIEGIPTDVVQTGRIYAPQSPP